MLDCCCAYRCRVGVSDRSPTGKPPKVSRSTTAASYGSRAASSAAIRARAAAATLLSTATTVGDDCQRRSRASSSSEDRSQPASSRESSRSACAARASAAYVSATSAWRGSAPWAAVAAATRAAARKSPDLKATQIWGHAGSPESNGRPGASDSPGSWCRDRSHATNRAASSAASYAAAPMTRSLSGSASARSFASTTALYWPSRNRRAPRASHAREDDSAVDSAENLRAALARVARAQESTRLSTSTGGTSLLFEEDSSVLAFATSGMSWTDLPSRARA
mmetsp:Transcript_20949/g.83479  ORF Transcript_20949/g.83479 Transcript_20949/m.83479 type:complete len:280 (-) Transcript_20949:826-1665(-)